LQIDPNKHKTEQIPLEEHLIAKEKTKQHEQINLKGDSSNTGDQPRITLGEYGRLDNLEEISLGFQPVNPVVFDIKTNVLINLKTNQFAGIESVDCNAHLTLFLEVQIII